MFTSLTWGRISMRVFLQFSFPMLQRDQAIQPADACLKECDLAKDRSFDMSAVEGAEPLDPKAGLEKLLRELGDVTCDYSINPPPWRNFHSLTWVCTAWSFWIPPVVQFSAPDLTDSVRSLVLHSLDYFGMGHCHHDCTNWKLQKDAKMGKHIRYLWGVVECPWWEASSASLKRNWLKCCKSPGAKVPDGKCQKRRSQQTTPLTSPQTLQETNFDRLPFYPRNRISRSAQQGGNMQCSRSTTKWIIKIYQGLIFQLEKRFDMSQSITEPWGQGSVETMMKTGCPPL